MIEKYSNSIFEAFLTTSKENSSKPAISYKQGKSFTSISYADLLNQSVALAGILEQKGVRKNQHVSIILENSNFWPVAFFAIMRLRATAVPFYPELENTELSQLIAHSDSKLIITSENYSQKITQAVKQSGIPILVINDNLLRQSQTQKVSFQEDVITNYLEQTALIVYTSGTTAAPKGVNLSHKNLLSNVKALSEIRFLSKNDCFCCLLPFHHTYPFTITLLLPLLMGAAISFPENLDFEAIIDCVNKTGVSIITGVPRLYTLIHEKIKNKFQELPIVKRLFLHIALNITSPLRPLLRVNLSKIIMPELHKKFGKRFRYFFSGGAKLNKEIAEDFYKWGFTILEGYGLTETSPVISFNTPVSLRFGSVGKWLPDLKLKINEPNEENIGEILVKGDNVTCGYYKDDAATRQVLHDGWLYTKDFGYIDKDGFLFVTGRKDDAIVLTSGKKIAPEELEAYYSKCHCIEEICVFLPKGSAGEDLLSAVILPNLEYFSSHGLSQIKDRMRREIENISLTLPPYKRIKKYALINEKLPKTLLGKMKRFEIRNKYSGEPLETQKEGNKQEQEPCQKDIDIYASEVCQKTLEYLSKKTKRQVKLDDHLELDLGLDSLERISLFFEFQKLSGIKLDEKSFFFVSTVRDFLSKIEASSADHLEKHDHANLQNLLNTIPQEKIEKEITLEQSVLAKTLNFFFFLKLEIFFRLFFQLKVTGKENIPKEGAFIFCPNHTSFLDAPLFAASLNQNTLIKTYFLGYSIYINSFLLKWGKKLFRLIPIDPSAKLADTLSMCAFVLKHSKVLCLFPEGGRSLDGELKEFKRGIGILIKELNVNVIPVYIKGAYQAWPPQRTLPHLGKIEVIFGKKLTPEELSANCEKEIDIYQNIANNLRKEALKLRA